MLQLHKDSHLDHALTQAQIDFLVSHFADREGFFIETVELPEDLGRVPCALHGPLMGDGPIPETEVHYTKRGAREYKSRMCHRGMRLINTVSVIAGPHDGLACVLYTAFGGPVTPREPADIRKEMEKLHEERAGLHDLSDEYKKIQDKILALRVKRAESDEIWSKHALASE